MTWIRSNVRPLLGLLIVIVAVLGAIFITAATPPRKPTAHVVKLIPVAYRAPSTGGGISVPHYFVRALRHHTWCGAPTTHAKRGIHGIFRQYFRHCQMAIGPVKVYGLAAPTPLPESSIIGGLLGGTPIVRPQPTRTRLPTIRATPTTLPAPPAPSVSPVSVPAMSTRTPLPPTPLPTVGANHTASCQQGSSTDCALMLVELINAERSQHGIAPLSYSWLLTNGDGTCIGAIGHATHMANDLHTIAHDQFPADVCAGTAMGENVGVSAYGSLYADAMQIHTGMMTGPNEVYTPGCSGNHHCDWMDPNHTHVGIAFVAGTFQGLPAHYESEEYSNAG